MNLNFITMLSNCRQSQRGSSDKIITLISDIDSMPINQQRKY